MRSTPWLTERHGYDPTCRQVRRADRDARRTLEIRETRSVGPRGKSEAKRS
ncbi:hypothetical protein JHFBIEKO_5645 [Methylobacterium mesophilicum]|nr:hypothetical protein JHFBIEKO_5645 [Methylobacterium mesophilicum]